jgi:Ca-activated chloride channel family protein
MSLLTPLFLLLALLAVPIILLYMLRLRRREVPVSSTMLWRRLLRDREANAPWQRLRRNLLLILQLLILAVLVLALARPFLPVASVVSGSIVVLLDGSASMLATDVEPDRFAVAQEQVAGLINDLGSNDEMTLILAGRTPQVLVSASGDRAELRRALAEAEAAPVAADWPAALALAAGAAQGFQEARIVLVSDGGLPADLPPLPADALYLPVGEGSANLAISALATARSEPGAQLFASVHNYGPNRRDALIIIELDGQLFDSRRVSVDAASSTNLTWELPPQSGLISARLSENAGDFLAIDDSAWAVHAAGPGNRALLATPGNRFLETALSLLPGVQPFKVDLESDMDAGQFEEFDFHVYDSVPLPDPFPQADLLIINPQAQSDEAVSAGPLLGVGGVFSETAVVRLEESPLLQFVDWSNVNVRRAQHVEAPWARPLVTAEGGPLFLVGEVNGHRVAILTFRLQDSDLPLQIAFPVLMTNIADWLRPGSAIAETTVQSGDPVGIRPDPGDTAVIVNRPGADPWLREVGEEAIIFAETTQPGHYEVLLRDAAGDRPAGAFAVNLFSENESAIEPLESIRFGQTTLETAETRNVGQRELWPWLAAAALVILSFEWWLYHRGLRAPDLGAARGLFGRFYRRSPDGS